MISEQTNDSKNISLLALFMAMFAFITAFANLFYQSYGESHSYSVVNITTNITTTTYVPKSYIIAGTGIVIDGLTVSFLAGVFAFVVGIITLIVILHYSKIITINKERNIPDTTPVPSASETPRSPPSDISKSDIEDFCKSVIAWKVSATEKDEIFQLFKENPYYLMGYLAYITKKNIEETKALQKKIIGFALVSIIVAMGSMAFAGYTINPAFFIPGLGIYALVFYGIFHVFNKSK